MISAMVSGLSVAGPRVATILVRRIMVFLWMGGIEYFCLEYRTDSQVFYQTTAYFMQIRLGSVSPLKADKVVVRCIEPENGPQYVFPV